ncbi:hypothetical protein [Olleya sp. UBA1516]|uniref:hypothetical protein n=1 Tax=Olleya sp. UBA1516 TaxID=1947013 RepID=UPI0025FB6BDC|nr:hypothetical protein [Olleya sp. UBA1516]|tara:strand:+ start:115 stop:1338 length:1224 start_codon:yes stop_codon:yes gene_type:complete
MKKFLLVLLYFSITIGYGQTTFQTLLNDAKTEFKRIENLNREAYDNVNFNQIADWLEQAILIKPNHPEARYYLGYTYSRLNAKNGRGTPDMTLDLLYKTSQQLEKVIQLSPKYTGEIIALNPYYKNGAEWGSMGLKYLFEQKKDSAIWAFKEGKKRGGFSKYTLKTHQQILKNCDKNALLISSGDMSTLPLYYLQTVKNYRNDVIIIDVALLNTHWYPRFLSKNKNSLFDIPNKALDSINYIKWDDQKVTINNAQWTVTSSYDGYLLRGDRLLLSILKQNQFKKSVYFTKGFDPKGNLGLNTFLNSEVLLDKVTFINKKQDFDQYLKTITNLLGNTKLIDLNIPKEHDIIEFYRYEILTKIKELADNNQIDKAKQLFTILEQYASNDIIPYKYEELYNLVKYYKKQL